jgi:hypothetical protein
MEISIIDFKTFIPKVALSDVEIASYLARSRRAVIRDGFYIEHKDFDELQRLYAMGLMQSDKIAGLPSPSSESPPGISSIGLSGLNIGFKTDSSPSSRSGKTGYFLDYENLKNQLYEYKDRIV